MDVQTVNWKDLEPQLELFLLSSQRGKTLARLQQIISENPDHNQLILSNLLKTYNQYSVEYLQETVLKLFDQILSQDTSLYTIVLKFIGSIINVKKSYNGLAPADLKVILNWINHFINNKPQDSKITGQLVIYQMEVLNQIFYYYYSITPQSNNYKLDRLFSKCVKTLSVLKVDNKEVLDKILNLKILQVPSHILFIAALSKLKSFEEDQIEEVIKFFSNEILLSKNQKTIFDLMYCLRYFNSYFVATYLSTQNFKNKVLPDLEKSILRSSEFIFNYVLKDLLDSFLNDKTDDIAFLILNGSSFSKLFTQLILNSKSSNESVRSVGISTLKIVLKSVTPTLKETDNIKVIDEISKSWKSVSNNDHKLGYISLLTFIDPSNETVNKKGLTAVSTFVTKDQNELLLSEFIKGYLHFLITAIENSFDYSEALKIVKYGLQDKKLNNRKYWFINLGFYLSKESKSINVENFIKEISETFEKNFKELLETPLKFPTVIGYVITCVLDSLEYFENFEEILIKSRYYLKLTANEEKRWFINSLFAGIKFLKNDENLDYGIALTYVNTTKTFDQELTKYAYSKTCSEIPENLILLIGKLISKSIYKVLLNKDSESINKLEISLQLIRKLVYAIVCPPLGSKKVHRTYDASVIQEILIELLIICHYKPLNFTNGWVGLVIKTRSNPQDVVTSYGVSFFQNAIDELLKLNDESNKVMFVAIVDAISTLSFIEPDLFGPEIKSLIINDLNLPSNIISEKSVEIWKCPEGELVDDPLNKNKKSKYAENKNSKDYATKKWEEDLKKEIQAKKGGKQSKKLTKEEEELVKAQTIKENEIKLSVQSVYLKCLRSIRLINALVIALEAKIDNGYKFWFPKAIDDLLEIVKNPLSNDLFGNEVVDTFLNSSNMLSVNNDSSALIKVKRSIGISILKLFGADIEISQTLDELVLKDLFTIKLLTDNKPLDCFGLIYLIPLLMKVINDKSETMFRSGPKISNREFEQEDPNEEQLLLSIDILANHSEVFENELIPRSKILTSLILSIDKVPARSKVIKECFNAICANISNNISAVDLKTTLIDNLLSKNKLIRLTILEQLDEEFILDYEDLKPEDYAEVWVSRYDNEETNAQIALSIWQENNLELTEELILKLISFLGHEDMGLRVSIARSIGQAINEKPEYFLEVFNKLIELFEKYSKPPPPILDDFGLVIKTSDQQKDNWESRNGIGLTFKYLAPFFDNDSTLLFFNNLVLKEDKYLADSNSEVYAELQNAGIEIIKLHGMNLVTELTEIFEKCISEKNQIPRIKQSAVIFYGVLASHLNKNGDSKMIIQIVNQLIKTLIDPSSSEIVQFTIAKYIDPLVFLFDDKLQIYFDLLFESLFNSNYKLNQRRGAAYGIAGLAKGYGIKALSEFDIIRNLIDAAENKSDPKIRQSVMFGFECLSRIIGKYFEPYVIEIVPLLLRFLGDHVTEVRTAADKTSQVVMKNTTSFGIKKLIPLAIENLDEISWRSKKGSVELLGSMAYLDPTQLSASLSIIVPEIVGVLNDSHKEVRKAAEQALKRFGEVIRNPEIQKSVPILIKAIGDPAKYTEEALDALIKTQFVHYIDGPSLALIIHVIHRGMVGRSASTKRKSCQIVGNMSLLVDARDLVPYLPNLIQELEIAMVDPVAMTRATAARALGSLVEKLGEENFPDLVGKLLDTLADESKAGDRLGSAQALAEILSSLGVSKLEDLFPRILAGASSSKSYVRAGYMPLLLYLPVCFGAQFSPYIAKILPPILAGLADNDPLISDTAIKAGKLIVSNYSNKAVDLLLPELEKGMSDNNSNIRLASVRLIGDLLFKIGDIFQKTIEISGEVDENGDPVEDDEERNVYVIGNSAVGAKLIEVLGQDTRDRVLSLLFICRSDTASGVRSAVIEIWNPLVANTPKTLKEILPTLANIIIRRLASPFDIQRRISALSLGDLVRRIGPTVLGQLLPTSEEIMISGDSNAKEGICIALKEIMESTNDQNIIDHQDSFVHIVADAIIDPNENVREAAAQTFDSLLECVGDTAIDGVIPKLLELLDSESDRENAVKALKELMANKADEIFPVLVPSLLSPPLDPSKAVTLGALSQVAGPVLYRYLTGIIDVFLNSLTKPDLASDARNVISKNFTKFLLSINDEEGCHPFIQRVLSLLKNEDKSKAKVVYEHLKEFFKTSTLDYSTYTADILERCIYSLNDEDDELVKYDWECLNELVKHQSKEMLETLVIPTERALKSVGKNNEDLKAFKINPRGPGCVLPIFIQGLMFGNYNQKEVSAIGIASVVSKSPAANLKPFFTSVTGPLIRVIGERVPSDVKAAILSALTMLLIKIPQFLRPFTPQLQRTFIKSLGDETNEILRLRAAKALGTLILYQAKIDPLVNELINGVKSSQDGGVKTAMLKALIEVVDKVGGKLGEASKAGILELVENEINIVDDKQTVAYAKLIGAISIILKPDEATRIIKEKILNNENATFSILTLNAFLKDSPKTIFESGLTTQIVKFINSGISSADTYLSAQSIIAAGKILLLIGEVDSPKSDGKKSIESSEPFELQDEFVSSLVDQLSLATVKPVCNETESRRLSLVVLKTVARTKYDEIIKPNLDSIAPSVFSCVRDLVIPIKLPAEKTFIELFRLIQDESMSVYHEWSKKMVEESSDGKTIKNSAGAVIQIRSIDEYTKRVASRLARQERERIKAGGDAEAMFSDRFEDEKEIWSVGGIELLEV